MEVVIPPRDHKSSTDRYTWGENGQVKRIERVGEPVEHTINRQTVQWPFQNSDHPGSRLGTAHSDSSGHRRATWQPAGFYDGENSPNSIDPSLIPDYVVNYLRGETPETLALKAALRARGPRDVNVARRNEQHHRSHAADFYLSGFDSQQSLDGEGRALHRDEKRDRGGGRGALRLAGWRGGLAINSFISFLVMIVGIVCLAMAIMMGRMFGGESTVFSGSCEDARSLDMGLHASISVLTIILLVIANYTFQVMTSPTRAEVDAAHAQGKWLDIGIPSLRNTRYISSSRILIGVVMLLSVFSIQVLYDGVIYVSRTGVSYDTVLVTEAFLEGEPFSNSTSSNSAGMSRFELLTLLGKANRNEFTNLTASDCLAYIDRPFTSTFSSMMLVTPPYPNAAPLLQTATAGTPLSEFLGSANVPGRLLGRSDIQYCLMQPDDSEFRCDVRLSGSLLGIVVLLNLAAVIAGSVPSIFMRSLTPLATLGDALASFLDLPDETTRGVCLLTKKDVRENRWRLREPKFWIPREHFWFQTPSPLLWLTWFLVWSAPTALAATALGLSIVSGTDDNGLSPFGQAAPRDIYILPRGSSRTGVALLGATPQILIATLYICTNTLMSSFYLSHELSQFAVPGVRKGLRLSSGRPQGHQTTSFFLTLPRPWSWLLLLIFVALSFLLSQSFFVLSVDFALRRGGDDLGGGIPATPFAALGTSEVGLLLFLVLLICLLALMLGLSLRRADSRATLMNGGPAGNPLVLRGGSCSAVLSSRCHRLPEEPHASRHRVAWGTVRIGEGMEVCHAAFSAREVGVLNIRKIYA